MKSNYKNIFTPLTIKNMTMRNRIMMTPMGTNYGEQTGEMSFLHIDYYTERAKGGVGLIMVENASVDSPLGSNGTTQIRIDHDNYLPRLFKFCENIHRYGTKIAIQINHAGASAVSSRINMQPVSASDVPSKEGGEIPRPLSVEEIHHIVKKYGEGENTIFALDHASLELEKGEMCVILGPSGSGKSTLLNMLGGLDSADDGTIIVDGCDLSSISKKELREYRRDKVGIVFQTYNLIGELTVRENIKVVRDISAAPLSIEELLKDLGLERHAAHFPEQLSGGQQQRCAIARALIKNPAILLCDEPTGALDSKTSRDVLQLLQKINVKYRTTILLITHNENIAPMADRILRIHDGRIVENIINTRKPVKELDI